MKSKVKIIILLQLIQILFLPHVIHAVAFCALRDPTSALHDLYPAATSHKSIVKIVDENTRIQISEKLPFTLLRSELGEHTLYFAMREAKPIGIVHMRSESTKWGIIEVAWSLDFDLKIKDFFIQRCRLPECNNDAISEIKQEISGKSFSDIKAMLANDEKMNASAESTQAAKYSIYIPILKSALKTILVTDLVWAEDIEASRYKL